VCYRLWREAEMRGFAASPSPEIDNADLVNQQFHIKGVTLDGLDANLAVNREGVLNVIALSE
jgi:HrpA-like RNA helicase